MKITEQYEKSDFELISVKSAKYNGNFTINIDFDNGFSRSVDFKPFLESSSHPAIKKYLDEKTFLKFKILDGNLNWNDYDLCFPVWDLSSAQI